MRIATIIPLIVWTLAIILGNYHLVSSTNQKIETYHNSPPFRIGALFHGKDLSNLLDSDPNTIWERKEKQEGQADFFLELKLTHFWSGNEFSPFPVKEIVWVSCNGRKLPEFTAKLILREAINVDKELRLPIDTVIQTFVSKDKNQNYITKPILNTQPLKKESVYPNGIYIYTLEMSLPKLISPNDCFSEIRIN